MPADESTAGADLRHLARSAPWIAGVEDVPPTFSRIGRPARSLRRGRRRCRAQMPRLFRREAAVLSFFGGFPPRRPRDSSARSPGTSSSRSRSAKGPPATRAEALPIGFSGRRPAWHTFGSWYCAADRHARSDPLSPSRPSQSATPCSGTGSAAAGQVERSPASNADGGHQSTMLPGRNGCSSQCPSRTGRRTGVTVSSDSVKRTPCLWCSPERPLPTRRHCSGGRIGIVDADPPPHGCVQITPRHQRRS